MEGPRNSMGKGLQAGTGLGRRGKEAHLWTSKISCVVLVLDMRTDTCSRKYSTEFQKVRVAR